jgi:hypothetical protein
LILHHFHCQQDPRMSKRHKIIAVVGTIAVILVLVLMWAPTLPYFGVADGK